MKCQQNNPLQRDGTSQDQRFINALEPGFAKVHELGIRDWMVFAYNYAAKVNYFNTADDHLPEGNWQAFFKDESEIDNFLKDIETRSDYEPHLALFLCFLKLLNYPQEHLNQFTGRHLDFYYREVLQLKEKPATPEKVHVIFELAKNATGQIVPAGTLLDAGKDKNGKTVYFKTKDEITVNAASVNTLCSVYHNLNGYDPVSLQENSTKKSIRYASLSNSRDGIGTPFAKEEQPYWYAFGNDGLLPARIGFSLASSILLLKEGTRTITVTLEFNEPVIVDSAKLDALEEKLNIYLTSEKGWIAPEGAITVKLDNTLLVITAVISSDQKAITGYNTKIHGEKYTTDQPVMRILFDAEESAGYYPLLYFSKAKLSKATINVKVDGVKDLLLENDHGKIDPAKPFMPFTSLPVVGSNFYLGSQEIFPKEWKSVTVIFGWKGTTENIETKDVYETALTELMDSGVGDRIDLKKTFEDSLEKIKALHFSATIDFSIRDGGLNESDSFLLFPVYDELPIIIYPQENLSNGKKMRPYESNILAASETSFVKTLIQNYLENKSYVSPYFEMKNFNPGFSNPILSGAVSTRESENDLLRFQLITDLKHKSYPIDLAEALRDKTDAPEEPYTPLIESLTVNYEAETSNVFIYKNEENKLKLDNYSDRKIQFFHEQPFGQAEQHPFLKDQTPFTGDKSIYLVPSYTSEGTLFIGLEKLQPLSIISLLFQLAEGSENPLTPTFAPEQYNQWYCMINNEWKPLNEDYLLGDTTNKFLRSGVVKILVPGEINAGSTLFGPGLIWLKVSLPEGIHFDAVCKFIDVKAQAALAEFSAGNTGAEAMDSSLPAGSVSKMTDKPALIKAVSQPFNSFGGRSMESPREFYRRVSERLRHKQRAVTIWDYERIILEKFPSVYKVKCLNHTCPRCELAPGRVSVIVVPDTRNKNMYDPFQPRVSQNLLSEIETTLGKLNSKHVQFDADNPKYDVIELHFKVKFYDQYDPRAYVKRLNQDIIKYLSPWAYDQNADIPFGGKVYKSVLIRYIEELEYVDFVSDFKMYLNADYMNDPSEISSTDSRSVLVSCKEHTITPLTKEDICK